MRLKQDWWHWPAVVVAGAITVAWTIFLGWAGVGCVSYATTLIQP